MAFEIVLNTGPYWIGNFKMLLIVQFSSDLGQWYCGVHRVGTPLGDPLKMSRGDAGQAYEVTATEAA